MGPRGTPSRSTIKALGGPSGLVRWKPALRPHARRSTISPVTVGGPRGDSLHLSWVRCVKRLSSQQCADIITIGRSFPTEPPTVVGGGMLLAHRVGAVHLLADVPETQAIYRLLWDVAADAAERHYGLAISAISRMPHFVEYEAGRGHFHWHNDYSHESAESPRKLTVVIQLSDPGDYEGGDLEVFDVNATALPREQGTILCLPSFVAHRVTPVTAGMRRVVVAWIAGPRLR